LQELLKKLQTVLMGLRPAAILTDDMYYIQLGETTCTANPSRWALIPREWISLCYRTDAGFEVC
jgi:hypothetical protein